MKRLVLALGTAFALATAPLAAAAPLEIGAYAGFYAFDEGRDLSVEDTHSAPENALAFGLRSAYSPAPLLIDIELSADLVLGEFVDGSRLSALGLRLEARHEFTDAVVRPYVALGPALQVAFTDDFGTDADLAVTAGGGLVWDLSAHWGLRFDVHWFGSDGVQAFANDFLFSLGATYTSTE